MLPLPSLLLHVFAFDIAMRYTIYLSTIISRFID